MSLFISNRKFASSRLSAGRASYVVSSSVVTLTRDNRVTLRTKDGHVVAKLSSRTGLTRKARLTGPVLIATALAVLLAACSGSSGGSSGSSSPSGSTAKSSASVQGITWAEQPASAPNCIFPLGPLTCETVQNAGNFQNLMDRPLYWLPPPRAPPPAPHPPPPPPPLRRPPH